MLSYLKTYKVVDPFKPTTPDQDDTQYDWNKCIWCQENTSESLTCPADAKWGTDESGYRTTAETILAFEKLGCLLRKMNLSQLEGEDIETYFRYHRAKWHNSCRLKFNKSKLQWAGKRKAISQDSTIANVCIKFKHRSKQQLPIYEPHCFFCNKKAEAGECCAKQQHLNLTLCLQMCSAITR